jgi:Fur family zinc uptake transcriptional regulator
MKNIAELLQEKKLKKTPLRIALLEIFEAKKQPLTIADMERLLGENNFSPNQTSLYRQVETLSTANILQMVALKNGVTHYELQTHHHHHFICEECESTKCIDDENLETHIHTLEKKLETMGIRVSSHQFSLRGKCPKCN